MDGRTRVLAVAAVVAALAVGILVGSGPMRALVTGDSTSVVDHLRAQLDEAEDALEAANDSADLGEDFADAATPLLLAGTLEGRLVGVVRTADATDTDAAAAQARLADAGATVGAQVALTDDWASEARAPFRDALAEQITSSLSQPPQGETTDELLAAALAQALAPGIAAGTDLVGAQATERADTLWTLLTEAGLVTGTRTESVDTFVLVTEAGDAELAGALDATSDGAVVAFTGERGAPSGGASTVTNATTFYGAITVTAALVHEVRGASGSYDASDAPELIANLNEF